MADSTAAGDDAQRQVVVLGGVEFAPESAQLANQRRAIDAEVAGVHAREKILRRPIRFKEGIDVSAVRLQFVLVAVDEIQISVGDNRLGDLEQGLLCQLI